MKIQSKHRRHRPVLILALAGLIGGVTFMPGPAGVASVQAVDPSWSFTGNLNFARVNHTATLLSNGKVLVAGGSNYNAGGGVIYSAELYNSSTGIWTSTGNLNTSRYAHATTLLLNGKVLVMGGYDGRPATILNSAELYDPATGTWSYTGNLNTARAGFHTATRLQNGKVLVVGGIIDRDGHTTNSAELYDPSTGTWTSTGSLNSPLFSTAMLLPNGKVLIFDWNDSAELYDPDTGTWSITVNPSPFRYSYTATLLQNGKVLLAGGFEADCFGLCPTSSSELYDPATGTWSFTGNLNFAGGGDPAMLLPSGKVLVVSGKNAELYDPVTGTWSITASLNTARGGASSTLLSNENILVAGGNVSGGPGTLNSAELYDAGINLNQIDDARIFVRQHYLDFLNREPDPGGLDYWTNEITRCGSDAACIHSRRIGVSGAFFVELEFQDTGYYVYRFYKASFARQPNYTEFTSDRSKVIGGSSLEAKKQAFADEWVQRAAFLQAFPNTMSNTEVVNKLFDSAGLTASLYNPQRQQEIQAMNAGRSRALILRNVIEIPDFKNINDPGNPRYSELKQVSQYNPAFVLMQYFGYLRRNVDQGGYDFWLDVLNNREPNNYRGMICSFITSAEYQHRFGSAVTRTNADCGR